VITFDAMVDYIAGMVDATPAIIQQTVNDRHREMVVGALWREGEVSLGVTVVGQDAYPVPSTIQQVDLVRVGTQLFSPVNRETTLKLDDPTSGLRVVRGGVFSESRDTAFQTFITLRPAPDTAGLSVVALLYTPPATMVYGAGASPEVPDDMCRRLRGGALGDLLRDVDQRPDLAAPYLAEFEQAVLELRRRRLQRLVGSSPRRALVAGIDFR
jgi:hypothetical protein